MAKVPGFGQALTLTMGFATSGWADSLLFNLTPNASIFVGLFSVGELLFSPVKDPLICLGWGWVGAEAWLLSWSWQGRLAGWGCHPQCGDFYSVLLCSALCLTPPSTS